MNARPVLALIMVPFLSACVDNTAPGNDREADLEPALPAAELASAEEALAGVATHLLHPEIMTEADQANLPAAAAGCTFRFTRVGFPVFAYGPTAGVLKLNGKLVPLSAVASGGYSEGGVRVAVRPLEEGEEGTFPAELVLRLADAPNEQGFHGFADC